MDVSLCDEVEQVLERGKSQLGRLEKDFSCQLRILASILNRIQRSKRNPKSAMRN